MLLFSLYSYLLSATQESMRKQRRLCRTKPNHYKVISEFSLFVGAGGGQSGPEKLEGNENKLIGWADIF